MARLFYVLLIRFSSLGLRRGAALRLASNLWVFENDPRRRMIACAFNLSFPKIISGLMVQPSQDRNGGNVARSLDRSMKRRIFLQCQVGSRRHYIAPGKPILVEGEELGSNGLLIC